MKYSEARPGRTFVIRLEDGEILHESLEAFAAEHGVQRASLTVLGGADKGSQLVVGPEESRAEAINPMTIELYDAHEITGTGTIFPNAEGKPILHLHIACGREENSVTGCARAGVKVWHVMEVVMTELLDNSAQRLPDKATGFELLIP
ncbi:MAG: DNA-binding protein [Candidatus Chlorobium antarcticum]|jgi:predicted DNA-binding protein with PD1-like motif|nr:DNA-binding protein [Candidatus Chlorobium antarcticum]